MHSMRTSGRETRIGPVSVAVALLLIPASEGALIAAIIAASVLRLILGLMRTMHTVRLSNAIDGVLAALATLEDPNEVGTHDGETCSITETPQQRDKHVLPRPNDILELICY